MSGRADATDTVIPSADTLVIVEGDVVTEIPDGRGTAAARRRRASGRRCSTRAYAAAEAVGDMSATDDCSLVLRYVPGARIVAVAGDEVNLKITTRTDMVLADRMIQMRTLVADRGPAPDALARRRPAVRGRRHERDRRGDRGRWRGRRRAEVASTVAGPGWTYATTRAVEAHLAAAAERLGGIDHVMCTAGVLRDRPDATNSSPRELAEVIDVNVTGSAQRRAGGVPVPPCERAAR